MGAHEVTDASGEHHRADLVVLCTGAQHGGPLANALANALADAPLRRGACR